ncbi:hypothetical protein IDH44_18170 [Paenibacillus sp. IB182496]|uniref:O-antigen ligase domain-containing protein n=1 Tax=Paenibacillus sabuli TaxID=2772509 RepID=A0A927BX57_9BACL|nr:hypothetical protein [Paenibacillus sabuli]MBD2847129.1 hypothetical protein [Paenibacillus sabuli]
MSLFIRRLIHLRPVRLAAGIPLVLLASYLIGQWSLDGAKLRILIFVALQLGIVAVSLRRPRLAMLGLLVYLPLMGIFRRWLIPYAGWSAIDPLILLAPMTVLLLGSYWAYRTYIQRQPIMNDTRLFRIVRWLLLIELLQVLNPLQGGLMSGLGGVIFYTVPLMWLLLTRIYADERWMRIVTALVLAVGALGALYGFKQMHLGFFDFELRWVYTAGYAALMIGPGIVRPFSIFTSAAEYTQYLLIATIIAWCWLLRGRPLQRAIGLLTLPLTAYMLFMGASRTPVVLGLMALAALTVAHARSARARAALAIAMLAACLLAFRLITSIDVGDNSFAARQVNGLSNPFDAEHSTLGLHWHYFVDGIASGLRNPLGYGLGATTLAGDKFGGSSMNSEVDFSNMLVSTGLFGGVLYVWLILRTLRLAFACCREGVTQLTVLGILLGTLGSWSIGGNYSTVVIIWLCIGYLDAYTGRLSAPESATRQLERRKQTHADVRYHPDV